MVGLLLRRVLPVTAALLLFAATATPLPGCPFCTQSGTTLTGEVNQASLVLYGRLENAKLNGTDGTGTTDLVIEKVLKPHDILAGRKVLTLDRYVPADKDAKSRFLVFCDVYKNKIDPYRGIQVRGDSDMAKYVEGAVKVKDEKPAARLRYFFDYLANADSEVSNDALKEFGNVDYKDVRELYPKLPADIVAAWLKDESTPAYRYGLYASILGHSGKPEHAALLRSMLDDPLKRTASGVDGILAGYILLKPKEGWEYLRGLMKDPNKDFTTRYAALRAARFFWDSRPDVIAKPDVVDAVSLLLEQGDIADLAIEDLRKWGRWEAAGKVLGLLNRSSHDVPIVRRAILRYSLSCPDSPEATAYVQAMRKKDAEMVNQAEELLKLESSVSTPAPKDDKK